jgi:hypothetical protein
LSERAQLVARVLEQHPHLAELVSMRLRAVSEGEEGHTPSKRSSRLGLPSRLPPSTLRSWLLANEFATEGPDGRLRPTQATLDIAAVMGDDRPLR